MAYGFLPHFLCLGAVPTTLVLGDCRDYPCAQGLSRPPSCSGTVQTTIVLGDCSDHSHARDYLDRPRAWGLKRLRLFLGIRRFPHAAIGDCPDHPPTIARRPLSSATCDLYSHTVERHLFFLNFHLRAVHLVSPIRRLDFQLNSEFFSDPGTTCLRHLLPGSGTKWAHFTLRP